MESFICSSIKNSTEGTQKQMLFPCENKVNWNHKESQFILLLSILEMGKIGLSIFDFVIFNTKTDGREDIKT